MRPCIECAEPAARSTKRCLKHLAWNKRHAQARHDRLKSEGTCVRCGQSPATVTIRCDPCAEVNRRRAAARRATKKAAGICVMGCEGPVWREGSSYCQAHREEYNPHRRRYGLVKGTACEACGGTHRLVHDHDHATGAFRGTLCGQCNVALGMVKDDPARLRALIEYLDRAA